MDTFTASNGVCISKQPPLTDRGAWLMVDGHMTSPNDAQALREFFRAEEDERLGRWRWPENPDYVVYTEVDLICITDERTGRGNVLGRRWYEEHKIGLLAKEAPGVYAAAGAYFDAHPEPKPWHAAKPGEVWVIVTRNVGEERAVQVHGDQFHYNDGIEYPLTYDAIESARRIWPETEKEG